MTDIHSCGFFVFRTEPRLSFLLMQHPARWDLPKGHVDDGESPMACALRELQEETGIGSSSIQIDDQFRHDQHYTVSLAKYDYEPRQKTLTIFLAKLTEPFFNIQVTEHEGYQWFDWDPPHDIQAKAINPVLLAVQEYWEHGNRPE